MQKSLLFLSLLLSALVPTLGPAAQDVTHGEILAKRWCSNCHVVARSATSGSADGVPTLPAIADQPQTTRDSLRRAMAPTHGRMPDFALTVREQDDLAAYILSLRRP